MRPVIFKERNYVSPLLFSVYDQRDSVAAPIDVLYKKLISPIGAFRRQASPGAGQGGRNMQPVISPLKPENTFLITHQAPGGRSRLPGKPDLHIHRRMFQIAICKDIRFRRRFRRGIKFSVRSDFLECVHRLFSASQSAVCHDLEAPRMIINTSVFINAWQHSAHASHALVIAPVARRAQRYALFRFHTVYRPKYAFRSLLRTYVGKDRPALRIDVKSPTVPNFEKART